MRIHAYVGRCQGYGNCAALDEEHFDRIIISAGEDPRTGLSYDDLKWLLERGGLAEMRPVVMASATELTMEWVT